jgi:hypothetical protein
VDCPAVAFATCVSGITNASPLRATSLVAVLIEDPSGNTSASTLDAVSPIFVCKEDP